MTVVVVTRNRVASLLGALAHLVNLDERPDIVVVDNASTDGTAGDVRRFYPSVRVVALPANLGAAGRNCGVAVAHTPYVAFSDDDSWWAHGALAQANRVLEASPRLGLVAARVLVGVSERPDPVCAAMEQGPLFGFLACGSVVRRKAFLDAGGFRLGYGVGGEEELLAVDLARDGWGLRYCPEIIAHHHPATSRDGTGRQRLQARNALRTAWLRRRLGGALGRTAAVLRSDAPSRAATVDALGDLRWIWHERRPVPLALERQLRLVGRSGDGTRSRRASSSPAALSR